MSKREETFSTFIFISLAFLGRRHFGIAPNPWNQNLNIQSRNTDNKGML